MQTISKLTDEELVYAVAQEVMGWHIVPAVEYEYLVTEYSRKVILPPQYFYGEKHVGSPECWQPIKDANHRDMVVERIRTLGWTFRIWAYSYGEYRVHFGDDTAARRESCHAVSNNLGRAVCEAAIEAVRAAVRSED